MPDKNTRKQVKAIIRKYPNPDIKRVRREVGLVTGVLLGSVAVVDFALLGGLGTLSYLALAGAGGGWGSAKLARAMGAMDSTISTNTAGQALTGNIDARVALSVMEGRLRESFGKAAHPQAPKPDKDSFLALARTMREEADILSSVFNIAAGGPNGYGTDRFEFIVDDYAPTPGQHKFVTLEQGVETIMKKTDAPPSFVPPPQGSAAPSSWPRPFGS